MTTRMTTRMMTLTSDHYMYHHHQGTTNNQRSSHASIFSRMAGVSSWSASPGANSSIRSPTPCAAYTSCAAATASRTPSTGFLESRPPVTTQSGRGAMHPSDDVASYVDRSPGRMRSQTRATVSEDACRSSRGSMSARSASACLSRTWHASRRSSPRTTTRSRSTGAESLRSQAATSGGSSGSSRRTARHTSLMGSSG